MQLCSQSWVVITSLIGVFEIAIEEKINEEAMSGNRGVEGHKSPPPRRTLLYVHTYNRGDLRLWSRHKTGAGGRDAKESAIVVAAVPDTNHARRKRGREWWWLLDECGPRRTVDGGESEYFPSVHCLNGSVSSTC